MRICYLKETVSDTDKIKQNKILFLENKSGKNITVSIKLLFYDLEVLSVPIPMTNGSI